jgi:hypothetical protein
MNWMLAMTCPSIGCALCDRWSSLIPPSLILGSVNIFSAFGSYRAEKKKNKRNKKKAIG